MAIAPDPLPEPPGHLAQDDALVQEVGEVGVIIDGIAIGPQQLGQVVLAEAEVADATG